MADKEFKDMPLNELLQSDLSLEDIDEIIEDTEFQADNKIQVSARKSTNNNPESKTRGENDETIN